MKHFLAIWGLLVATVAVGIFGFKTWAEWNRPVIYGDSSYPTIVLRNEVLSRPGKVKRMSGFQKWDGSSNPTAEYDYDAMLRDAFGTSASLSELPKP